MPARVRIVCVAFLLALAVPDSVRTEGNDDLDRCTLDQSVDTRSRLLACRAAVEQGSPDAEAHLGELYALGLGVYRNYGRAVELFESGAKQQSAAAMASLGRMYKLGQGVPRDYRTALGWLRKAVQRGSARAIALLGEMHAEGKCIPKDCNEAVELLTQAAEMGNVDGMVYLAGLYASDQCGPQDYGRALEWLSKAAEVESIDALDSLARIHDHDQSVRDDQGKSSEFRVLVGQMLSRGTTVGHADAKVCLGRMYAARKDYSRAVEFFQQASQQGHAEAQRELGLAYARGHGVPQDPSAARIWLDRAGRHRDVEEYFNLGNVFVDGEGVLQRDSTEALKWYYIANRNGHEEARIASKGLEDILNQRRINESERLADGWIDKNL